MPENLNDADQESQREQDESTEESQAQATNEEGGDAEAAEDDANSSDEESSTDATKGSENATSGLYEGIPEEHPIRSELTSVRAEAAARRSENRTLQSTIDELRDQLGKAKTQEEFDQAIADYDQKVQKATLEATRERVGRTYGLPDELVSRLAGDTEEELTQDAEKLKSLFGDRPSIPAPPKNPPRGGLDPTEDRFDVKTVAARIRNSRGIGLG